MKTVVEDYIDVIDSRNPTSIDIVEEETGRPFEAGDKWLNKSDNTLWILYSKKVRAKWVKFNFEKDKDTSENQCPT